MERWKKLAYDVGVNVVANLIAAAILYLGGSAAGLFPPNPSARAAAWGLLALLAAGVTGAVLLALDLRSKALLIGGSIVAAIYLVGVVLVALFSDARDIALLTILWVLPAAMVGSEHARRRRVRRKAAQVTRSLESRPGPRSR